MLGTRAGFLADVRAVLIAADVRVARLTGDAGAFALPVPGPDSGILDYCAFGLMDFRPAPVAQPFSSAGLCVFCTFGLMNFRPA